jgi:hypothetical protein
MGKRSDFRRVERDAYNTPLSAVLPLLQALPAGTRFIEPCCGALRSYEEALRSFRSNSGNGNGKTP